MNARTPQPAALSGAQTLRDVRRGVAEAGDAQVLQVVRMVDALEVRGASDDVLAPVRPRLRAIQPARPLRFARLLFMPADPLIVPGGAWRPGTPFLPRHALVVLARAVRVMLAEPAAPAWAAACLAETDALIASATTAQAGIVRQAGGVLWPRAAIVLRRLGQAPTPTCVREWTAEQLPEPELAPLATALAAILGAATALHEHDQGITTLRDDDLVGMMASAEKLGSRACGMMLSLLMIRVPQGGPAMLVAAQKAHGQRKLVDAAVEAALAWVEGETANQVAGVAPGAAAELNRQVALLETLAGQVDRMADPAHRRRVALARGALLAGSLQRFEAALQERVAVPLHGLPENTSPRDAALDAMEAGARILRAFDLEARRLGGGAKFDALVQGVGQAVQGVPGLSRMDRARLMEILAGPEAALRLLAGKAP